MMNNREMNYDKLYAALKLVQALYKNGDIPQYLYKNIINDYQKDIDIAEFQCYSV